MKLPKWLDNKNSKDNQSSDSYTSDTNDSLDTPKHPAESSELKSEATMPLLPLGILAQKMGVSLGNKISDFFLHNNQLSSDEKAFYEELSSNAESILKEISEKEMTSAEGNTAPYELVSDMQFKFYISEDQMIAYGFLMPSVGGGQRLEREEIKALLEKNEILFGVNEELLTRVLSEDIVFKIFTLAEGKAERDGIDGQVIDMFSREKQTNVAVDDDEIVDFKNLHWLQKVQEGEVICKIVPPVPAEDGMTVKGVALKGLAAKSPKLPIGKNVIETEDHTALIAGVGGQLTFISGIFKVDPLIQIDGDVDSSVGNIDAIGNITVKGNVFEGFSIKTTGDILVHGTAVASHLTAGGNIKIVGGMNGGFKGKLEAGGTVSCRYLENCYVIAGGTVKADSIVSSTVISSDQVIANTGKGTIIGSTITCFKGVEAKVIGNERSLLNKITIGSDPKLSEELRTLKKEVIELRKKSEEYDKNIQYLSKMEKLDEIHQQLLNKLKLDFTVMNMNLTKKSNRIQVLEEELKGSECQVIASQIFPPLTVTIGTIVQHFYTESRMSRIYKHEGEIILGSK